jgi:adenine specific DNA methylase Mod
MNKLYFGDNLDVLRECVADDSVDLIYLDPPFNSQAQYNVLFQSPKADAESAQAQAFRDTWIWGDEAEWRPPTEAAYDSVALYEPHAAQRMSKPRTCPTSAWSKTVSQRPHV